MTLFKGSVGRVLLASFLIGIALSLSFLFLNFHLEAIGFDRALIGYANAVPAFAMVFLGLPVGFVMPRVGYVRSLGAGLALSVIGTMAVALLQSTPLVFAGLLLSGLGQGVMMGASAPLLARLVPEAERVRVFAWQAALSTGAGILGNGVGGYLPALLGGTGAALATAPLFLLLGALPLLGVPEVRGEGAAFRIRHPDRWAKLILPQWIVSLGAGLVIPFLNLYLQDRFRLSYDTVGWIFALSQFATVAAMLIQPRIAARFGKVGAIVAMQAASLPFILVLAYVPFLPLVTLALFMRGALMNAANPVFTALSMDLMADEERAAFTLFQAAMWNVGWAMGSSFSGRLQLALGTDAFLYLFAGMLALYTLATLCYLLFFGLQGQLRAGFRRTVPS